LSYSSSRDGTEIEFSERLSLGRVHAVGFHDRRSRSLPAMT
jgi:hypothetical protein